MTVTRPSISHQQRFEVLKRDRFTCQYCGQEAPTVTLEIDHIEPLSVGGSHEPSNFITSCRDCNRGKGGIPLQQTAETNKERKRGAIAIPGTNLYKMEEIFDADDYKIVAWHFADKAAEAMRTARHYQDVCEARYGVRFEIPGVHR